MTTKYNYVLCFDGLYAAAYSELYQLSEVCLLHIWPQNKFMFNLYRLQHSNTINSMIRMPFKSIWYPYNCKDIIFEDTSKPICFVFLTNLFEYDYNREFISYLRKKYPNCKIVGYYTDLIRAPWRHYTGNIDKIRPLVDLLVNYDKREADEFGMVYQPTSFGNILFEHDPSIADCDVYYLGAEKIDRHRKLLNLYEQFTHAGLKCEFYISNVPKEKQKNLPGMHYIKPQSMSYIRNLQHVDHTRCILELMQENAVGYTMRLWESINYGKALITDNQSLEYTQFYDNNYVSFLQEGYANVDFVRNYKPYNNPLKNLIKPIRLIENLESNL